MLTEEQNENLRKAAMKLVKIHGGNLSKAARSCGISQPHLDQLIYSDKGGSLQSASKIADALGIPIEDVVGGRLAGVMEPWGNLPGFAEALQDAIKLSGAKIPREIWAAVSQMRVAMPQGQRLTAMTLLKAADLFLSMNESANTSVRRLKSRKL